MLTTIQNRICASYRYTDPQQKPTWKGKRFRFLIAPPARLDLWEEYVQTRHAELIAYASGESEDPHCRKSHALYLKNRSAMDAGAIVANPHRFNPSKLPDGTQTEDSALQFYYNEVARIGPEAVATELDNDPPEEAGPVESGITARRIQRQLSGYDRKIVPPGCIKITRGVDCRKVALHWVVRAWRPDGSGFTIDYGVHEVQGTTYNSDEGLDVALKRSILDYLERSTIESAYCELAERGELKPRVIDRTLIDAGWRTDAVYAACREAGLGVMPVMGCGRSAGCVRANFSQELRATKDKKPGDGWFLSRRPGLWLVLADSDRWKAWEHDRWMTAPGRPGCMMLFGQNSDRPERLSEDEKAHHSFARHICNEVEVEEPHKGTIRRRWKTKSDNVHYLDASYYSDVAANMEGIRVVVAAPKPAAAATKPRKKRVSYL